MVKDLSSSELLRRKQTRRAVEDYFGERVPTELIDRITKKILNGSIRTLEPLEAFHAKHIKDNMQDKQYVGAL